jgi:hypothetical protein
MHHPSFGFRLSTSLVTAVLAASAADTASAQVKNWNAGDGNWGWAANWSPIGLPGGGSQVFIGNTVVAENDWVTLNVNASIASLTITDGMVLDSDTSQLVVAGATVVSGQNSDGIQIYPSRIQVRNGPAAADVILGSLSIADDAMLEMEGGTLLVSSLLDIEPTGNLFGEGVIRLTSNASTAMVVDGGLGPAIPLLTISQEGDGRVDLDGSVAGDETINITLGMFDGSDFARLTIIGDGLADPMDDDFWIGEGNELTMLLDEGWTMGAGTTITFFGGFSGLPAYLKGSLVTLRGTLDFAGSSVYARIEAPATFESTATAAVGSTDLLECTNDVTLEGGSFTLDLDANIEFDGDTVVQEASFATYSADINDGTVEFNGATIYDGTLTINGSGQQNGDVTVAGPTVIDAVRFDLDGANGTTSWDIGNSLIANLDFTDTSGSVFNGSIDISGTFSGKLTLNKPDPSEFWIMNGSMSLGGVAAIMTARLAGNPILFGGSLDVTNRVRADCPLRFESSSTISFANASSRLRSTEYADIWDGASFTGGQFENAPGALLMLFQGASLGSTALLNEGDLEIGSAAGIGFVSNVTLAPTSRWLVEIGGAAPAFEHDKMQASGDVALAGQLDIDLIDLDDGIFEPAPGATFTILEAPAGAISGTFANQPVSFVPGKAYVWTVGYDSGRFNDTVKVKVADIIPCPADLNGDGQVDAADLAILLGSWGPCPDCNADFDLDDFVDAADLAVLLGEWGSCL